MFLTEAEPGLQRDFAVERPEEREHFREGLIKAGLPA